MKKALYVLPYPRFFSQHAGVGGHVAHAAGIVSGLLENGFCITVLAEESHDIFDFQGVSVELAPLSSRSAIARQWWSFRLIRRLRNLVQNEHFAVCYMRYSASFAPWIPLVKRILGDVPLVLEVNSLGSQWRSVLRPLDRLALKSVDRVICISRLLEDFINELLGDGHGCDVRLVINGVNITRFGVEPVDLGNNDSFHAGFAGLLKADYGIETLIESARLLKDDNIILHVFGDGPYRAELESSATGVQNIQFHGAVPFVDMPSYLKALDILVYTTDIKYLYQSPTKLFEYMAAGKPIVSARTPQTIELLEDHKTALFFDVGSAEGLADAVRTLLVSPEQRLTMGELAREEVVNKHSWSKRVAQILQ